MHRLRVSAFLVAISLGTMAASAGSWQEETPIWWSSATTAFDQARLYNPVHTVTVIEELDTTGAVISLERGETRAEWSGENSRVIVVSAEKNGKDTTEEWRKRYARQTGTASSGGAATPRRSTPSTPRALRAERLVWPLTLSRYPIPSRRMAGQSRVSLNFRVPERWYRLCSDGQSRRFSSPR